MRIIKFRAWDSIRKRMNDDVKFHKESSFVVNKEKRQWIIMQFTGIKDKNGKDIYEGDICEVPEHYENDSLIPNHKVQVIFNEGMWMLVHLEIPSVNGFIFDLYQAAINDRVEVIGNIYENIELLCDAVHAKGEQ